MSRSRLRRTGALPIALAGVLLMTAGIGVAGANNIPHPELRLSLLAPPATMPSDTAFWIGHGGHTIAEELPADAAPGSLRFELTVDGSGVLLRRDVEFQGGESVDSVACEWYRNFAFGLPAGEHHFEGRWYYRGNVFLHVEVDVLFV